MDIELRVPIDQTTQERLDDLQHHLAKKRKVRRVTRRQMIQEALDLLFRHHAEQAP
jgi:hypothetical protein